PPSLPSPPFPYTTLFRSGSARRHNPFYISVLVITRNKYIRLTLRVNCDRVKLSAAEFASDIKFACIIHCHPPGKIIPLTSGTFRSEEHTSELQSRGHLVC